MIVSWRIYFIIKIKCLCKGACANVPKFNRLQTDDDDAGGCSDLAWIADASRLNVIHITRFRQHVPYLCVTYIETNCLDNELN